ncbi:ABC transporter permease subunit [Mycoplasmatota bacterium]|nr:ABC transporter permease subunit [Mycoplasmatota bacterium]
MNIFLIELKAIRKSLIFWCLGMVFMVFAGMSKYKTFDSTGVSINEMMKDFPKSVTTILGLGNFDLTKASGFYGVLFLYLIIMATIHAVMLGANIIAKEERDKTAEFLFVKPISRTDVITAKLLASLVSIFILNITTLLSSIIIVNSYSNEIGVNGDITILMFGMFILQLIFLFLGTMIAAYSKNPKLAMSISTGILLLTFILSVIIDMTEKINFLKYFTPFKYFEAKNLMGGGNLDIIFVLISFILVGIFIYFTYVFYKKRDLTI